MDHRRIGIERLLHIADRRAFLPIDGDEFGRVLGDRPSFGNDGGNRFALPQCAIHSECILRHGFQGWLAGTQ